MEGISKDLLLYATATSVTFENAAGWLSFEGMPAFAQSFSSASKVFATESAALFFCMGERLYGLHFLPGTDVPLSFLSEGISYTEYHNLMFGNSETSPGTSREQVFSRCGKYVHKVFQASMDAAIRAAKDDEPELLQLIAHKGGLLYESALFLLWLDDAISGAFARAMLFIPDSTNMGQVVTDLTKMEEIGDSEAYSHRLPLTPWRFPPGSGLTPGERIELGFGEKGRVVNCNTQESYNHIKSVLDEWHNRLCSENGIL